MIAFRILTLVALTTLPAAALAQDDAAPAAETPTAATPQTETPAADTADDQGAPAPDDGFTFVTEQPANSLFSSDLVGWSVYGPDEEKIGDINDLLIQGDGEIEAVIIGVGGFLGVGEKDVAVPIGALDVTMEEDRVVLHIAATEAELQSAPVFVRSDGTTSDRLGAFERTYERARRDAEEALGVAGERAEELTRQAQEEAGRLVDQGREAVRQLTGEEGGETQPEQQ